MTAVQDDFAIQKFLNGDVLVPRPQFRDRQLKYLNPQTASFTDMVEFDLTPIASYMVDFQQAYLHLPLTIVPPAGQVFNVSTLETMFKDSLLTAISGVNVVSNGVQICDERSGAVQFGSHLRLMLEKDIAWQKAHGSEICFAIDRSAPNVVGQLNQAQIQYPNLSRYVGAVGAGVPAGGGLAGATNNEDSPYFNQGFYDRVQFLYDATIANNGTVPASFANGIPFVAQLPLRYLNEFFANCGLLLNVPLRIQFYLSTPSQTMGFSPICVGSTSFAAGVNVPNLPLANSIVVTPGQTPRLYYSQVVMEPEQLSLAISQLRSGKRKMIPFRRYIVRKSDKAQLGKVNGDYFSYNISPSAVGLSKVYVLCIPAGMVDNPGWPGVLTTGANGLTQVQCTVNSENMFQTTLSTPQEQWNLLQQCMETSEQGDSQSLLSYSDFIRTHRILALDVERARFKQADPNAPINITLSATLTSVAPCDILFVEEHKWVAEIVFTDQNTVVSVYPERLAVHV